MSARERILAKLRASEKFAERVEPDVASWFAGHRRVESGAEKAARFRQCIELAHAEVYNVNRGSWLQKLWEVLAAKKINRLLVSPGTEHGQRAMSGLATIRLSSNGKMRCFIKPRPA